MGQGEQQGACSKEVGLSLLCLCPPFLPSLLAASPAAVAPALDRKWSAGTGPGRFQGTLRLAGGLLTSTPNTPLLSPRFSLLSPAAFGQSRGSGSVWGQASKPCGLSTLLVIGGSGEECGPSPKALEGLIRQVVARSLSSSPPPHFFSRMKGAFEGIIENLKCQGLSEYKAISVTRSMDGE